MVDRASAHLQTALAAISVLDADSGPQAILFEYKGKRPGPNKKSQWTAKAVPMAAPGSLCSPAAEEAAARQTPFRLRCMSTEMSTRCLKRSSSKGSTVAVWSQRSVEQKSGLRRVPIISQQAQHSLSRELAVSLFAVTATLAVACA